MAQHVAYRTVTVDGPSIFYREAGPGGAPTLLMPHGLPSSRMFEPLLTRLASELHMIAPDYAGFGHSDAPGPKDFPYTFDRIAAGPDRAAHAAHEETCYGPPHLQGRSAMQIPTTMTATVLVAPHRFELQQRPVPVPGDEDVLVRVRACGV